jgi:SH3/ankyrin repeat-containing protein
VWGGGGLPGCSPRLCARLLGCELRVVLYHLILLSPTALLTSQKCDQEFCTVCTIAPIVMSCFVTLQMEEDAGGCSAPPPEEGYLLVRIHVPELNVQKCLQFPRDQLVWDVKQQCLAALPKVTCRPHSASS